MVDCAFDAGSHDTTSPRRAALDAESAACGELARRVARCSGTVASHTPRRVLGLRVDRVIAATAWAVLAGLITFGLAAGATAQTQTSQPTAARAAASVGRTGVAAHPSGAATGQSARDFGPGLPVHAAPIVAAAEPGATPGPAIYTSPVAEGSAAAFAPSQAGPRDAAGASGGTVLPGSGGTAHRDASLVTGRGPASTQGPAPLATAGDVPGGGSQWAALFAFGLITVVGLGMTAITWRWALKVASQLDATTPATIPTPAPASGNERIA